MKHIILTIGLIISANICFADSIQKGKNNLNSKQYLANENKAKDYSSDDFDWNNLISAVIGGLIGLSPTAINYFKKTKIKGKLISQYSSLGTTPEGNNRTIMLQKLSIFTEHKNFYLKDIEIFIKHPNSPEIRCENWIWRTLSFVFIENNVNVMKRLMINKNEYLLHYTVFPKEQSIVGYISYTFDSVIDEKFEYVKYLFKDYKGNVKELKIDKSEIMENTQMFDDSIWN